MYTIGTGAYTIRGGAGGTGVSLYSELDQKIF